MQSNGDLSFNQIYAHKAVLQSILRRRWWSRVWVSQEVSLARDVIFRIGHAEIPWAVLSGFLQKLDFGQGTRALDFINGVTDTQAEAYDLIELAVRFRTRIATDPRDKIFGLLALVHSSHQAELIKPDYSMSPLEVFVRVVAMHMASSQSLASIVLDESRPAVGCL